MRTAHGGKQSYRATLFGLAAGQTCSVVFRNPKPQEEHLCSSWFSHCRAQMTNLTPATLKTPRRNVIYENQIGMTKSWMPH